MEFDMESMGLVKQEISDKEFIASYIGVNCLEYPEEPYFGKLPGTRYSSQYYLSKALYNSDFLLRVSREFERLILQEIKHFNFQLSGREWSSIPLLVSIPLHLKSRGHDVNSFLIRKERKKYGKHNIIEGNVNDLPVLMVDDLCNSSDSFRHQYKILKYEGLKPLPYLFAVLNKYKKMTTAKAFVEDRYCPFAKPITIVNGDDIDNVIRRTKD